VWLAALLAPVLGALGILLFAMALVGDRGQQRTLGHSLDQLNRLIDNVVAAGQVKQH
jgi:Na+/phosphate symporter